MQNTMNMHLTRLLSKFWLINIICLIEFHALIFRCYNMLILICLMMFLPLEIYVYAMIDEC